jgi:hypothetical protein
MCVTCLFEEYDLSLFSTNHVALRTNYNTEITYHKHTHKHNQTRQTIEKCLFNNLDFLGYCDKRDMAKRIMSGEIWIWELSWESSIWLERIGLGKI